MKKNQIIKIDNHIYRVLSIKNYHFLGIDCIKQTMPAWIKISEYSILSEEDLYSLLDQEYEDINDISPKRAAAAYKQFSLIAGILACIEDKQAYTAQIKAVSEAQGISKQTIRNYLIKYLIFQNIAVLAPKEPSRARILSDDEKNFRWALNRYFYNQNQHTLTYTYKTMLQNKYCDINGQLLPKYPSYNQFYYYYRNTRKMQNYLISRNGLGDYQRNERPLLGDGVQEYAPNLGVGMLDGTICDIYLVDDAGNVIGRPVLTACIDANTSMLLGYCLSWEGGIYNVRNLMLNVIADKVEWCKKFGIHISKDEWNCYSLPGRFLTDKGSEYISENFSQLSDLGITLIDLPAFRPDLKSFVEKSFDIIQNLFKQELKGKGVVEMNFNERTNRIDYRKQARLTLKQFETILIHCILYYNNQRVLENYPYTEKMLRYGIAPYASSVWNYRLSEASTNLIPVNQEHLALTLLPRTTGRFTRQGLKVNKLRYHADGFTEEYLSGGDAVVAYSPDDVSRVWLFRDCEYTEFRLIESRYEGKDLQTVEELKALQRLIISQEETNCIQAKIDLSNHIRNIVIPTEKKASDIRNIRAHRKTERTKNHKQIGGEIK